MHKKNNVLIQKTVTILRKECPSNASRSTLSRKLVLVPAGLLHHQFHIRSPKAEIEEGETRKLNIKRTLSYAPLKHL